MADAYGTVNVWVSNDFKGDINKVCDRLNEFYFGQTYFEVKGGNIYSAEDIVQYPTATPSGANTVYYEEQDGTVLDKRFCDLTDAERKKLNLPDDMFKHLDNIEDIEFEEFTKYISELIENGKLYISCNGSVHESPQYEESLEINPDGSGKRTYISHWQKIHEISDWQ